MAAKAKSGKWTKVWKCQRWATAPAGPTTGGAPNSSTAAFTGAVPRHEMWHDRFDLHLFVSARIARGALWPATLSAASDEGTFAPMAPATCPSTTRRCSATPVSKASRVARGQGTGEYPGARGQQSRRCARPGRGGRRPGSGSRRVQDCGRVTVNPGVVRGVLKANMVEADCSFEVDDIVAR